MKTKEELLAYHRTWYSNHKEQECARRKKSRANNIEECLQKEQARRIKDKDKLNAFARERYAKNPEVQAARTQKWRQANPDKNRNSQLKRWYGITLDEYNYIFEKQNGKCAICGIDKPMGIGCFHVDHDHITKEVRGLLCQKCNMAIGLFRDNSNLLRVAADYLDSFGVMRTEASLKELLGE